MSAVRSVSLAWCFIAVLVVIPIHWFSERLNIEVKGGKVSGPTSWFGNRFASYFLDRIDLERFKKAERTIFERLNGVYPLYNLDEEKPILILASNVPRDESKEFFKELITRIEEAKRGES